MVDAKASKAFVHVEHESSSLSSCNFIIWYEVLLLAFRVELHSCAIGTVPDSYAISTSYHPLHREARCVALHPSAKRRRSGLLRVAEERRGEAEKKRRCEAELHEALLRRWFGFFGIGEAKPHRGAKRMHWFGLLRWPKKPNCYAPPRSGEAERWAKPHAL
jgi:hypothetical protein